MYIDNKAAYTHLTNDMTTQKSKTINIAYHKVRDHVKDGEMTFHLIPTLQQMADALTKAVPISILSACKRAMGLQVCK